MSDELKRLRGLIDAYGRACRRDGNPAWESDEGKALAAELEAPDGEAVAWMNSASLTTFKIDRERYPSGGAGDLATARYMRSDHHNTPLYTRPPTGDAAGKDSVDAARVFALTERVPEVGQRVIVVSENWCAPKILEYVAFPHPRLLDRETGRWYWYPERMQWQALSAPVIAAIASLTKTADGENT